METYFRCEPPTPALILRRTRTEVGIVDEAFRDGIWQPTSLILAYMAGQDDDVEEIPEVVARQLAPEAFT